MLSVGGKTIVKSNHIVKTRLGNNINLHLVSSKKIVKSKFIVKSRFVKSNLDCTFTVHTVNKSFFQLLCLPDAIQIWACIFFFPLPNDFQKFLSFNFLKRVKDRVLWTNSKIKTVQTI